MERLLVGIATELRTLTGEKRKGQGVSFTHEEDAVDPKEDHRCTIGPIVRDDEGWILALTADERVGAT